jgi:Asp-tRNA(Asn)/Glu-tRNA(Gln) amidotransferase A subunit family amidase
MSVADQTALTTAKSDIEPRLASIRRAPDNDLTWLPAWRIRALIGERKVSPVEVVEHFLRRIETLDPQLHAFRMVDAEGARRQARVAEAAVMAGEPLGPLHGVPMALKEFLPVEGLAWTDLLTQTKTVAPRDSIEAERLRKAGAILVGTTVAGLTAREFGASDRQPQNPWDRSRVCGDSSGGSACAQAAALVPAALAQDGLGSTRLPAAFCGLVGLVATRGRVACADWAQMNSRLLSASGPLSRDVRDAATVLSVLAGPDGRDLMCLPDAPPDYLDRLDGGARGFRLVWTDDFGYAANYSGPEAKRVIAAVRATALSLAAVGAEIEETGAELEDPSSPCGVIMVSDRALAVRSEPPAEKVLAAREARGRIHDALVRMLASRDFILSPTVQYTAPTREAWAEAWTSPDYMGTYSAHTAMANLLGWPALSVPAGLVDGMPVGLQILGPPNSEPRMLQLAQAFLATRG